MLVKNSVANGKIIHIQDTHAIVEMENSDKGLLHVSEISDYYVREINSIFKIGKSYDFLIIDTDNGKLKLSWKKINPRFMKNPFKFTIKETKNGNARLYENLERNLND